MTALNETKRTLPDWSKKPIVNVGIIGASGRMEDAARMTNPMLFNWMVAKTKQILRVQFGLKNGQVRLITGGSAWADHIAPTLFLNSNKTEQAFYGIDLYHATWFDEKTCKFASFRNGQGQNEATILNDLHKQFSNVVGHDTLRDLWARPIADKISVVLEPGFLKRNTRIADAASDILIAFSWHNGSEPKPGSGTRDTWNKSKAKYKVHVSLFQWQAPVAPEKKMSAPSSVKQGQKRSRDESSSSSSSSSKKARVETREVKRTDQKTFMDGRFGRITGTWVNGIVAPGRFDKPAKSALGIFQLPYEDLDPDPEEEKVTPEQRELWMSTGNVEEPKTLTMAAKAYGYVYEQGECQTMFCDEEFPFLAVTPDQTTKDRAIEVKFKSKTRDKPVKRYTKGDMPPWRMHQLRLQMRITKKTGGDVIERSDVSMERYRCDPGPLDVYWPTILPKYKTFYNTYLAWYWERDLSRAMDFVELCQLHGVDNKLIGATLNRAFTDDHEVLRDGKRIVA